MFGNSKRHTRLTLWHRQSRAARLPSTEEQRQRRRHLAIQLGLGLATIIGVTLIVHAGGGNWGPPFSFREGEVFPRDIRVKVDFTIVDEAATQLKREQAAAAVNPVFHLDPAPLTDVKFRLAQLCLAARSGSREHLDAELVRYWALTEDDLKSLGATLRGSPVEVTSFFSMPSAPVLGMPLPEQLGAIAFVRVRNPILSDVDLIDRIDGSFEDLIQVGVLDDAALVGPIGRAQRLTIHRNDNERDLEVIPEQVLKSRLVGNPRGDKGPIFLQFAKAFRNEEIAHAVYALLVGSGNRPSRLSGTLTYDAERTNRARNKAIAAIPEQRKEYKRGAPLIEQGKSVTAQDLPILLTEHRAYLKTLRWYDHLYRLAALFLVTAAMASFVGLYVWRFLPTLTQSANHLVGFCGLILVGLLAAVLMHQSPWYAALLPLTMTAMILAIAYDQPFALVVSFSLALIIKLALGTDLERQLLVLVSGLTVAILLLRRVRTRSQLAKVGLVTGLNYAIMTFAAGLLTNEPWSLIGRDATRCFLCGLTAGLLLVGLLPVIERVFGIVTDLSLLELADVTHPLMQDLVRRAPGTYTHSMTVALLAEAAAKEINGNTLLTRIGACYHDVGKMLKPHYFVENQTGENRHEGLAPAMSTLIIIGHVKDGVELGRQHRLPEPVVDFIEQHHGTTLVEYFYREAIKSMEPGQVNGELEASFRYPGPKPQSKEIGIVMLADALEGASRALGDPTPSSLRKLTHELLMKRLLDGQFDESGLTLTELKLVEDSLCKSLIALFHARVKYPAETQPAA